MRAHVTYDECAPFLANAVGYKDGAVASPWRRLVVAHHSDATVCPELAALFKRGPFDWKINARALELFVIWLLEDSSKRVS